MAAVVRATAITGSHRAAPMAMRPGMANGAVAGKRKRETSSGPALSAWNFVWLWRAVKSLLAPGVFLVSGRAAGLSGYSKMWSTTAACSALSARERRT